MKKLLLISLTAFAVQTGSAQTQWYQKEKRFRPFIAGAAAAGDINMFKDLKVLKGANIWSAVETGFGNKNTSVGIAFTSYEWGKFNDIYFGPVLQRRMFHISRAETWISAAYGIPFKGELEKKVQFAARERVRIDRNVAVELSVQKTVNMNDEAALKKHLAAAIAVVITIFKNVHSNHP